MGSSSQGERRANLTQESDYQGESKPNSYGYPETRDALMLRRTILKVPTPMEPLQRKSIFHTTCQSGGKVCKALIDSGINENFVSIEMVEKLKLRRIPHPYPYKVYWLTKGQQTLVEEQSWVEF